MGRGYAKVRSAMCQIPCRNALSTVRIKEAFMQLIGTPRELSEPV